MNFDRDGYRVCRAGDRAARVPVAGGSPERFPRGEAQAAGGGVGALPPSRASLRTTGECRGCPLIFEHLLRPCSQCGALCRGVARRVSFAYLALVATTSEPQHVEQPGAGAGCMLRVALLASWRAAPITSSSSLALSRLAATVAVLAWTLSLDSPASRSAPPFSRDGIQRSLATRGSSRAGVGTGCGLDHMRRSDAALGWGPLRPKNAAL